MATFCISLWPFLGTCKSVAERERRNELFGSLVIFVVFIQWLSHIQLFVTPWTAVRQTSLCLPLVFLAAAAAKSLQSCLTLCDPRDGSPPGSPVPGILQARVLEWGAIAFSGCLLEGH